MTDELNDAMEEIQASIIEDTRKIYSEKVIDRRLNPINIGGMENPEEYGKIFGPCVDTIGCGTSMAAGRAWRRNLAMVQSIQDAFKVG